MKTQFKKQLFDIDERNKQIAFKVMSVLYLLTIVALQGIILYRQFALNQDISDFADFGTVMIINSVFLISALLYFGAVQVRRLSIRTLLLVYVVFVVLGGVFVYAKNNLFHHAGLSFVELTGKILIIATIAGLLFGFWILLALLGKRRTEKELE